MNENREKNNTIQRLKLQRKENYLQATDTENKLF